MPKAIVGINVKSLSWCACSRLPTINHVAKCREAKIGKLRGTCIADRVTLKCFLIKFWNMPKHDRGSVRPLITVTWKSSTNVECIAPLLRFFATPIYLPVLLSSLDACVKFDFWWYGKVLWIVPLSPSHGSGYNPAVPLPPLDPGKDIHRKVFLQEVLLVCVLLFALSRASCQGHWCTNCDIFKDFSCHT